jgi:hypothetical protein
MGGKSQKAPDYGPLAQASKEAAQIMAGLGREQLDFARQQYGEMMPLARQVAGQQMAAQEQQMSQAQDYYDYMRGTFRPVEQGLVSDAERFSTEGYREQMARDAAAAVGRAFGTTQASTERAMASMGVSPASGRFASSQRQDALGLASQRAQAMTGGRQQAEQMGWARRLDVTGLGRNLPGASAAAYQGATTAGSAGLQSASLPGAAMMSGMGQAANTIGSGQQMQLGGLSNILGAQTSVYNVGQQQSGLDVGGLLSGGAALMGAWPSDSRLKENIEWVGRDDRTGIPLYEFNYVGDPDHRYRGVMAQDVEQTVPEAVSLDPTGYKLVNYDMLGMEMVEVPNGN